MSDALQTSAAHIYAAGDCCTLEQFTHHASLMGGWAAVNLLNALGSQTQFGLLSPGLGFDHFLDMRQDAIDAEAKRTGGTPRTIEGPLYVAGAPEADGFARLDDEATEGETMWLTGQVRDVDGTPIPGAKVEMLSKQVHGLAIPGGAEDILDDFAARAAFKMASLATKI